MGSLHLSLHRILKEVTIESFDTGFPRFNKCSNSKCGIVYPINSEKELENSKLCPSCLTQSQFDHIIQCRNCESIIGFFDAEAVETPNVFYVEHCNLCKSSDEEDDEKILPFMFPHLML
jgi:hypothetical protein